MEPKIYKRKKNIQIRERKSLKKNSKMTNRKEIGKEDRNTGDVLFYFRSAKKKLFKRVWKIERVIESSQKDGYKPCEEIHK